MLRRRPRTVALRLADRSYLFRFLCMVFNAFSHVKPPAYSMIPAEMQPSKACEGAPGDYVLTDLNRQDPGVRRLAHGYATSGTLRLLVLRGARLAYEIATALPRDLFQKVHDRGGNLRRIEPGRDPATEAARIAIYIHYSPDGRISEMVRLQVRLLAKLGFAIVFVTMAEDVPDADWRAMRDLSALVVQRRNFGLDFGAYKDLAPEIRRRWPGLTELLLANDSVMGPIYPLAPIFETFRSAGDGVFGLTESLQGGPHLQSYMLLIRGQSAVADGLAFLENLFVSHSKWLLIQFSEIRLARWMRGRGHRVAALFGYERLLREAMASSEERERLAASHRVLKGLDTLPDHRAYALLQGWPLNPSHHLWHVLVTRLHGPFIKTELVRRNPGHLPGVAEWPAVVPPESPCPLPVLKAHLKVMGAG